MSTRYKVLLEETALFPIGTSGRYVSMLAPSSDSFSLKDTGVPDVHPNGETTEWKVETSNNILPQITFMFRVIIPRSVI